MSCTKRQYTARIESDETLEKVMSDNMEDDFELFRQFTTIKHLQNGSPRSSSTLTVSKRRVNENIIFASK